MSPRTSHYESPADMPEKLPKEELDWIFSRALHLTVEVVFSPPARGVMLLLSDIEPCSTRATATRTRLTARTRNCGRERPS